MQDYIVGYVINFSISALAKPGSTYCFFKISMITLCTAFI